MGKIKFLLIVFCLLVLLQNTYADSLTVAKYKTIKELLTTSKDSIANLNQNDLFLVLGMAVACVQDTSVEKQVKADKLFSFVSSELEKQLKAKQINENSTEFLYLNEILKANQYIVRTPTPSDGAKFWEYIKQGRFEYIGKRIIDRGYIYWILGFVVIGGVGLVWKIRKQKR